MKSEISGAPWEIGYDVLPTMRQLVAETASKRGDFQYVEIDPWGKAETITVTELWERSQSFAAALKHRGVKRGDNVVFCYLNSLDLMAASWAAISLDCSLYLWHVQPGNPQTQDYVTRSTFLQGCLGAPVLVIEPSLAKRFPPEAVTCFPTVLAMSTRQSGEMIKEMNHGPDSARFYIQTSGTTGRPKLAALRFQGFCERQLNFTRRIASRDIQVSLCSLPFDNITAFSCMNPVRMITVFVNPGYLAADPSKLFEVVSRFRVDTLSMTSTAAAALAGWLESNELKADITSLKSIGFGMEPIIPAVLRRFYDLLEARAGKRPRAAFGYGMTEMGSLCNTGLASLEELLQMNPGLPQVSVGPCVPGKAVRVVDENGRVLPRPTPGRIEARVEMGLIEGYLNESGTIRPLETREGWMLTGDLGFIRDDALTITGREKELLIVRGRKISLLGVEEAIRKNLDSRVDFVAAVAVESDRMVLFFSTKEPGEEEIQRIGATVLREAAAFAGVQASGAVHLGRGDFPLTRTGKINRIALAEKFREGQCHLIQTGRKRSSGSVVEFSDPGLRTMAELWREIMGLADLPNPDANFYDLGGDSLKGVSLVQRVESLFVSTVDTAAFFSEPTVAGLYHSLRPDVEAELSPAGLPLPDQREAVLIKLNRGNGETPLFMIPGGMGTRNELMVFAGMVRHFASDRQVYGIRAPLERWKDNEPTVEMIAEEYIREIRSIQVTGPYLICGECIAGVIAYEIARQLVEAGERVAHLILLDPTFPSRDRVERLEASGYRRLREAHGEELASMVYPYSLALAQYRPSNFAGDVTLIGLEATLELSGETQVWENLISGSFIIKRVPGNHHSYLRKSAPQTAQILEGAVADALG